MKTNTASIHPKSETTRQRERAFTLTDLLAVIVTLAIMTAVILPALARSGDNGARAVCANNLRQLGMALNMYVSENQDTMPWVNWGSDSSPPCPPGWLYKGNANIPNNLYTGNSAVDAANWPTGRVANLQGGVYWQYIQNPDVFMCPVDALSVGTALWDARTMKLSTYIMNSASAFFPLQSQPSVYGYRTCKISQIWSPMCIIKWEPNSSTKGGAGAYAYNDGSSFPDTWQGPGTVLHVTGVNVLAVGGSTRFMSYADVLGEIYHNQKNDNSNGKGLMWWNPLRTDGHATDN